MSREPKWAHLSEIDKRTHVGTPAWYARNSHNAQKLSAWRRIHALEPHEEAMQQGINSGMTIGEMVETTRRLENESK